MGFVWTLVVLAVALGITWRYLGSSLAAVFEGRVRRPGGDGYELGLFTFSLHRAAWRSRPVHARRTHTGGMADFLAVLGLLAFVVVMLGLIAGLDRV